MRFLEPRLGDDAIGDLPEHALHADDAPAGVADRRLEDLNVYAPPIRPGDLLDVLDHGYLNEIPGLEKTRVQVGPLQLTQEKLVNMMLEINKGLLTALHIGRLKDQGLAHTAHVSFGKLNNVRESLAICREARTILGASGITLEYPVIRHMNNLESVLTYEGTSEVHTLILGQAITGENAFS